MATSPGGILPPGSGSYVIAEPVPLGIRPNAEASSALPPYSTVSVAGVSHVLAMNAAKHPPAAPSPE